MGREFGGEGIHVYVWLSPFAIYWKQHYLSISCVCVCARVCACSATPTPIQNQKLKKNKNDHRYKNLVEKLMQKKRAGREISDD